MKLFVFDLENTLVYNELMPELARLVGRQEEVERITRLGVEGRIDWVEGFRQRARFLAGIAREDVLRAVQDLRLVPGALGFVKSLRARGHRLGLITGGPSELARRAMELFGADKAVSNDFVYEDGRFTGEVVVRVTPSTKGLFALEMARSLGVEPRDTVAFADGVMDTQLLRSAGVAVGVNAHGALRGSVRYEVRDFEEAYRWLLGEGLI
jgi:phosphoserine phosphatase